MSNPWESIDLNNYESHMRLDSVKQLQTMNDIMLDQFYCYNTSTAMVLGIAGGNGLEHVDKNKIKKVYGVDINNNYLNECEKRFPSLKGCFYPVLCDLQNDDISLPEAEIIIANLFIEYVGYDNFLRAILQVKPKYVSCVIQINTDSSFVSDSPYLHTFDSLEEVHREISKNGLIQAMKQINYILIKEEMHSLPNGKALLKLDFS